LRNKKFDARSKDFRATMPIMRRSFRPRTIISIRTPRDARGWYVVAPLGLEGGLLTPPHPNSDFLISTYFSG